MSLQDELYKAAIPGKWRYIHLNASASPSFAFTVHIYTQVFIHVNLSVYVYIKYVKIDFFLFFLLNSTRPVLGPGVMIERTIALSSPVRRLGYPAKNKPLDCHSSTANCLVIAA